MFQLDELLHDYIQENIDQGKISLPKTIRILDATLTEGEQCPGLAYTPDEKLSMAEALSDAGVHAAFIGFPIVSREEKEAARRIIRADLGFETWGLCRVIKSDIDELIDIECDVASFIAPVSPLHYKKKLRMDQEDYLMRIEELCDYSVEHGLGVAIGMEDASRGEMSIIKKVADIARTRKGCHLLINDSVGVSTPATTRHLIEGVKTFWSKRMAVHFHDDLGMATANTLAAVEAAGGVSSLYLYVTVNGIGERCGVSSLEEVCTALKVLYGYDTGVDLKKLLKLSRLVETYSGIPVPSTKAVVGFNAFTHETGTHVHGVLIDPRTYEPYSPEEIGRKRKLVFGKYSGRNLIKKVLEEKGIHFEDAALDKSLQVIKETHERKEMEWKKENNALLEELHRLMRKRSTTDDEAIEIAKKVMN